MLLGIGSDVAVFVFVCPFSIARFNTLGWLLLHVEKYKERQMA